MVGRSLERWAADMRAKTFAQITLYNHQGNVLYSTLPVSHAPTHTASPTKTGTATPIFTAAPTFTLAAIETLSLTLTPGYPACYSGTPSGLLPSDEAYIDASAPDTNRGNDNIL